MVFFNIQSEECEKFLVTRTCIYVKYVGTRKEFPIQKILDKATPTV